MRSAGGRKDSRATHEARAGKESARRHLLTPGLLRDWLALLQRIDA